jgi:regulation of enolase protein 1 (concanavalin A-like superfamily)
MSSRTFSTALLLTLFLAWVPCAPGHPSTQAPAAEVEIKALPRRGAWTNAPKDFKRLADDSFAITASKQTDLYNNLDAGTRVATAPMLLFPADDTFVLTTGVKFLFEKSHYGPFSVCSNVTNGPSDDSVHADVPTNEVYLRLTRAKDVFVLYYSVDGKKWAYIRYFRFPVKGPLKVGFASQSPTGEQCTSVFSKVRYSAKEVADFWTGEPKE